MAAELTPSDHRYLASEYGLPRDSDVLADMTAAERTRLHDLISRFRGDKIRRDASVRRDLYDVYTRECERWKRDHAGESRRPVKDLTVEAGKEIADRICNICHLFGIGMAPTFFRLARQMKWDANCVENAVRHSHDMVPITQPTEERAKLSNYINSFGERGGTAMRAPCDATLLRIFIGDDDTLDEKPLYDQIVLKARAMGVSGATVMRGVLAYGPASRELKILLRLSEDFPVVVEIVDDDEKIKEFLPVVEDMIEWLITMQKVASFATVVDPKHFNTGEMPLSWGAVIGFGRGGIHEHKTGAGNSGHSCPADHCSTSRAAAEPGTVCARRSLGGAIHAGAARANARAHCALS